MVPSAGLADHLLQGSELAAIVGDTSMELLEQITGPAPASPALEVVPFDCIYRLGPASTLEYVGKFLDTIVGDLNRGPRGQTATQVITAFVNRDEPRGAVTTADLSWRRCQEGQQFTVEEARITHTWIAGATNRTDYRVTTGYGRVDADRTCHHVLASQANLVVEAMSCGDGDTAAEANRIADRLLEGFPD
jgi:hypothetical protein